MNVYILIFYFVFQLIVERDQWVNSIQKSVDHLKKSDESQKSSLRHRENERSVKTLAKSGFMVRLSYLSILASYKGCILIRATNKEV